MVGKREAEEGTVAIRRLGEQAQTVLTLGRGDRDAGGGGDSARPAALIPALLQRHPSAGWGLGRQARIWRCGRRLRCQPPLAWTQGVGRRAALAGGLAIAMLAAAPAFAARKENTMYGLMGRMIAQAGQRDALAAILLEGTGDMPGCLAYIVAKDLKDDDAIWVTEVWADKDSHAASLALPAVRDAIARGKPLIAGFDSYTETEPLGGVGPSRLTQDGKQRATKRSAICAAIFQIDALRHISRTESSHDRRYCYTSPR